MSTTLNPGRLIGVLILSQIVLAIFANFVLVGPAFAAPGYLVNAAPNGLRLSLAAVLNVVSGGMSVAIAVTLWPLLREQASARALWLLVLGTTGLVLCTVESATLMSMLSLSQAHAKQATPDAALFDGLRGVVSAARNWAHYLNLMLGSAMLLLFYTTLFKLRLVPRVLAAFALGAVSLQFVAVTMPLFGPKVIFAMLMPLGVTHLATALWLCAKGFDTGSGSAPAHRAATFAANAGA